MAKRLVIFVVFLFIGLPFVWLASTMAQQGPNVVAIADATATQCAAATPVAANQTQILAASLPGTNQQAASTLCFTLNNQGTANTARCGDSVSATQGQIMNPVPSAVASPGAGGSWSACVTSAINCCGVGGSTIIGGVKYTR